MDKSAGFKERFNKALSDRGISQASLAAILDVPRSSISNWIKNESIPTDHLVRIALELNISIDWLINGEGPERLLGPQYIAASEKAFIESLRMLGKEITQTYLDLIHQTIAPAYGETPYESIGLARFVDETHIAWGIVGYDGRIELASHGLYELLKLSPEHPGSLIGTPVFQWISEEYMGSAVKEFTRFLEGKDLPHNPKPFRCRLNLADKTQSEEKAMYYSYEIHPENPQSNKIHVIII